MKRRSILAAVREEKPVIAEPVAIPATEQLPEPVVQKPKPNRGSRKHIGGYYHINDPTIKAFQKLGIDLDKDQQDMLHEAIRDYVAKHEASRAFNN
jgi:hypothetical protein